MSYFLHPNAICESQLIGDNTRIWAFTHVLPNAKIGSDCNICDHVFVENDVIIGDRVTIKCGVQVWDGVTLEDDVFIGPNVTFTNDPFPRSKHYPEIFSKTLVRSGASVGANATILPGVTIGIRAMIGAGAVVTHDVPPYATVVGNPARIIGYTQAHLDSSSSNKLLVSNGLENIKETSVKNVTIHDLPLVRDLRGNLSVGEFERNVPFVPMRYFIVFDVPNGKVRGEHAHKQCHQFLICIKGTCSVVADDGYQRQEILLDRPNIGVHLPPLTWGVQYKYSSEAVLLVFASHYYDTDDYIRDYDQFLEFIHVDR